MTDIETMLAAYRESDKTRPEIAHALLKDFSLRNLVVSWTMLPVQFVRPKGDPPPGGNAAWQWLWTGVSYDRQKLSVAVGVDTMKMSRLMERAIILRLIYPDGGAAAHALALIRGEILKSVPEPSGHRS